MDIVVLEAAGLVRFLDIQGQRQIAPGIEIGEMRFYLLEQVCEEFPLEFGAAAGGHLDGDIDKGVVRFAVGDDIIVQPDGRARGCRPREKRRRNRAWPPRSIPAGREYRPRLRDWRSIPRRHGPSGDLQGGDCAADGENGNRRIEMDRAAAARGRCGGDEGADLEAALPGVAISLLVGVGRAWRPCPAAPSGRGSCRSQASLIMPLSGVAGQCEMPPVHDQRDALGHRVGGAAKRFAERPGPMQRRQRRSLAIDIGRE